MRIFGLTLLLLLSVGIVHGYCPVSLESDGAGGELNPETFIVPEFADWSCFSDILDLVDADVSGETTTLIILGSLQLSDSSLVIANTAPTTIYVNSTGELAFVNTSNILSNGPGSNLTIFVEEGGSLLVENSELQFINVINLSSASVIVNSSIRSFGPVIYNYPATISSLTILSTSDDDVSLQLNDGTYTLDDTYFSGEVGLDNSNVSFYDSNITERLFGKDSLVSLFNTPFGNISFTGTSLYQYWPVNILVLSDLGFPIYGISVSANDTYGNITPAGLTFTDGLVTPNLLSYSHNDTHPDRFYSNYTISAYEESGSVYLESNKSINVSGPLSTNLSLDTIKGIVRSSGTCTQGRPFCVNVNPVTCENMKPGNVCDVQFVINGTSNNETTSLPSHFFTFFLIGKGVSDSSSVFYSDNATMSFSS